LVKAGGVPDHLAATIDTAKLFMKSGFFKDAGDVAKAAVKILAGRELGIGAFASIQGISLIQGKLNLSANLQAALLKKSGKYDFKVLQHTNKICQIEFFYKNGKAIGVETFSIDDAKQAGLLSNQVWAKYPKNMLFARCLTNGIRFHCPDIGEGSTLYDEYEASSFEEKKGEIPTIYEREGQYPDPEPMDPADLKSFKDGVASIDQERGTVSFYINGEYGLPGERESELLEGALEDQKTVRILVNDKTSEVLKVELVDVKKKED